MNRSTEIIILLVLFIVCFSVIVTNHYNQLLDDNKALIIERDNYKDIAENSVSYNGEPVPFSSDDYLLLSKLVEAEAGDQDYKVKLFVASVVMNRIVADDFPSNINDVIFHKGQFEVVTKKIEERLMIDCEPSRASLRASWEVLHKGSVLPSRVVVFYDKDCTEPWVNSLPRYCEAGGMVFSYIK